VDIAKAKAAKVCRDLGQRVLELRVSREWTQQELADAMGVDVREVRRVEAGDNLTVIMLTRLSLALNVGVGELFERPARHRARHPGRPRHS